MEKIEFAAPTLLGIEAVTANELKRLGAADVTAENGRVYFSGDEGTIASANLWLRTAERVLIKLGDFNAKTFDELFQGTRALPWERWIPEKGTFPVKGYSLKSKLFSVPDCQSIVKKAVVERLRSIYKQTWFEETGPLYQIQFSIMKDQVTLMLDTSGPGLHKRGYREGSSNLAPIKETLAAAMVLLSDWRYDRPLLDPFCGSGTIPVEAALIGNNIAPGINREFIAQSWPNVPKKLWWDARRDAFDQMSSHNLKISGSDIDEGTIKLCLKNADRADVGKYIDFIATPVEKVQPDSKYGCIITNPPYGRRLGELREVEELYRRMGWVFGKLDTWSYYIISSHEEFERFFGKKADKNRKMYNGMIKCYYYQYFGPRPPREKSNL